MIFYLFLIGGMAGVILVLGICTWYFYKRKATAINPAANSIQKAPGTILVKRQKSAFEVMRVMCKKKLGRVVPTSLSYLLMFVVGSVFLVGIIYGALYVNQKFFSEFSLTNKLIGVGVVAGVGIISVFAGLLIVQHLVNRKKTEGGKKFDADTQKKKWKEAYEKTAIHIDAIRNFQYLFILYIPLGWFVLVEILRYFHPELRAWHWIRVEHPKLYFSTPFVFLVGFFFFRIKSIPLKILGLIIWLPLFTLWSTEGKKELPDDLFKRSERRYYEPPVGVDYRDVEVTRDWSTMVGVPFKRSFNCSILGDEPAIVQFKVNNDDRLVFTHDFGGNNDLNFAKHGIKRVESFQIRSVGPDVTVRVVFTKIK